jgi:hypothetical protein
MGVPADNGPDVDAAGSVVVVLVDDADAAALVVVVEERACGAVFELQDAKRNAPATATSARAPTEGRTGERRCRFPRIGKVWRAPSGGTVHPW